MIVPIVFGSLVYLVVAVICARKIFVRNRSEWIEEKIRIDRIIYHKPVTAELVEGWTLQFDTHELFGSASGSLFLGLLWWFTVPLLWMVTNPVKSPSELAADNARKDEEIRRIQKELDRELAKGRRQP